MPSRLPETVKLLASLLGVLLTAAPVGAESAASQTSQGQIPAGSSPVSQSAVSQSSVSQSSVSQNASSQSAAPPQLRPGLNSKNSAKTITPNRIRRDRGTANTMARYHWLDRAAQADPQLIESITEYHFSAMLLAKHPRLGEIAEADHYLCRRLTRWKDVSRALASNPHADRVIALDPEGIYRAIKNDRRLPKRLAKNPMFHRMISDNPDLGKLLSTYM